MQNKRTEENEILEVEENLLQPQLIILNRMNFRENSFECVEFNTTSLEDILLIAQKIAQAAEYVYYPFSSLANHSVSKEWFSDRSEELHGIAKDVQNIFQSTANTNIIAGLLGTGTTVGGFFFPILALASASVVTCNAITVGTKNKDKEQKMEEAEKVFREVKTKMEDLKPLADCINLYIKRLTRELSSLGKAVDEEVASKFIWVTIALSQGKEISFFQSALLVIFLYGDKLTQIKILEFSCPDFFGRKNSGERNGFQKKSENFSQGFSSPYFQAFVGIATFLLSAFKSYKSSENLRDFFSALLKCDSSLIGGIPFSEYLTERNLTFLINTGTLLYSCQQLRQGLDAIGKIDPDAEKVFEYGKYCEKLFMLLTAVKNVETSISVIANEFRKIPSPVFELRDHGSGNTFKGIPVHRS